MYDIYIPCVYYVCVIYIHNIYIHAPLRARTRARSTHHMTCIRTYIWHNVYKYIYITRTSPCTNSSSFKASTSLPVVGSYIIYTYMYVCMHVSVCVCVCVVCMYHDNDGAEEVKGGRVAEIDLGWAVRHNEVRAVVCHAPPFVFISCIIVVILYYI